jgi:hypothetical protein
MITDKDREDAKAYLEKLFSGKTGTGSWHGINDKWSESELVEMQTGRDYRIRAESAEQARKESAELAVEYCSTLFPWGKDGSYAQGLRDAIIGDSAPVSTDAEKLAVAVKALEKISRKGKASSAFDSHFSRLQDSCAFANDALREIQG